MTTARAFLRRLLTRSRAGAESPQAAVAQPGVEERLEAARQRLKETISAPEEAEAGHPPDEPGESPPGGGPDPPGESPPGADVVSPNGLEDH